MISLEQIEKIVDELNDQGHGLIGALPEFIEEELNLYSSVAYMVDQAVSDWSTKMQVLGLMAFMYRALKRSHSIEHIWRN